MFKKIMVATDFSKPSLAALHTAISVGELCKAQLIGIHVASFLDTMHGKSRYLVPLPDWQGELQKTMDDFFPYTLYPESERLIVSGRPVEEILKHARSRQCDLIVVGTHGRGAAGRLLLGSVTQRLTRDSEIPVMAVRDLQRTDKSYQNIHRVLVPTDFSDSSVRAIDLAVRFANFMGADLHLIHVVDLPAMTSLQDAYPFLQITVPELPAMNVDPTLRKTIEPKGLIGKSKVASLVGDPVHEILAYAEKEQMDFIVMGTHGRKGLERVLLGSVTSGVVAGSKFPVITVSTPETS